MKEEIGMHLFVNSYFYIQNLKLISISFVNYAVKNLGQKSRLCFLELNRELFHQHADYVLLGMRGWRNTH